MGCNAHRSVEHRSHAKVYAGGSTTSSSFCAVGVEWAACGGVVWGVRGRDHRNTGPGICGCALGVVADAAHVLIIVVVHQATYGEAIGGVQSGGGGGGGREQN